MPPLTAFKDNMPLHTLAQLMVKEPVAGVLVKAMAAGAAGTEMVKVKVQPFLSVIAAV